MLMLQKKIFEASTFGEWEEKGHKSAIITVKDSDKGNKRRGNFGVRTHQTDFSKGNVYRNILELSIPMTLAQLLNLLYNVVDRMYIGRIPGAGATRTDGSGNLFSGDHNDCGIYISVWEWRQSALCNGTGTRKS